MEEYLETLLQAALTCPVAWGYFEDGQTLPRVTITQVSGGRVQHLNGKGSMRGSLQIDCWGKDANDAIMASREVKAALEIHRGGPVMNMNLSATRDKFSTDGRAASRRSLTFAITYRE